LWTSIPNQLAKENRKFIYSIVKKGARAKDLEHAMQWLLGSGMAYSIKKIEKPAIPLSAYADPAYFKMYLSDIGLLRRMANLPSAAILGDSPLYSEFKGALVENFVLTEIVTLHDTVPYYWKSKNTAEVDFLMQIGGTIVPMEVKASQNVKSRSLGVYREKYQPEIAIRTSLRNLRRDGALLNIPLYLLWNVDTLVADMGAAQ
jgi:predicted AAA+ superfamily ATPase